MKKSLILLLTIHVALTSLQGQVFDQFSTWKGIENVTISDVEAYGKHYYLVGQGAGEITFDDQFDMDGIDYQNGLIALYDTVRGRQWIIRFQPRNGPALSSVDHIARSDNGDFYVCGTSQAGVDISGKSSTPTFTEHVNFFAKYEKNTDLAWAIDFTFQRVYIHDILVRNSNEIIIYGQLNPSQPIDFNPRGEEYLVNNNDGVDIFIATYNQNGILQDFLLIDEVERRNGPYSLWESVATLDHDGDVVIAYNSSNKYDINPTSSGQDFLDPVQDKMGGFVAEYDKNTGALKNRAYWSGLADSFGYFLFQEIVVDTSGAITLSGMINEKVELAPVGSNTSFIVDEVIRRMFFIRLDKNYDFDLAGYWKSSEYNGRYMSSMTYDGGEGLFFLTPFVGQLDLDPDSIGEHMVYADSGKLGLGLTVMNAFTAEFEYGDVIAQDSINEVWGKMWNLSADSLHDVWIAGMHQGVLEIGDPLQETDTALIHPNKPEQVDAFFTRLKNCLFQKPNISRDGDVLIASGNYVSVGWYDCSSPTFDLLSESNTVYLYDPGEYAFVYTTFNGCSDTICSSYIPTFTSQSQISEPFQFYPNPTSSDLNVRWGGMNQMNVEVLNAQGQHIHTWMIQPGQNNLSMDLGSGVYFLKTELGVHKLTIH